LKPAWTGKLTATGRVVKGGRTIGFVECDIVDEKQRLVARASSTVMTLRGAEAAGRGLTATRQWPHGKGQCPLHRRRRRRGDRLLHRDARLHRGDASRARLPGPRGRGLEAAAH